MVEFRAWKILSLKKLCLRGIKKLRKALDNFVNSVYNYGSMKFNLCIESNPIETYESCQVRKEAAISR